MTALLHELFADAAARTPDAPAIRHGDTVLTYAELAARVDALAASLQARLPRGARVALNLRKSPRAVAAMLACLRAGVPYVPVDPLAPLPRRRAVLADSGATAILLDDKSSTEWAAEPGALDGLLVLTDEPAAGAPEPVAVGPDDLAYLLYTSGSTGVPKGVEITHGNAAAFVHWGMATFDVNADDRVAVHAPLHFDLPVFDVFVGLARGATLCLVDERTAMFPAALLRFLAAHRVTVLYAVPTAYVGLVQQTDLAGAGLGHLRWLLYAGEEFHPTPLRQLVDALPHARVANLYGPVETNVVTSHHVTAADLDRPRIPIGRPVAHARLFLLDGDGAVVTEPGAEGEIVVGGPSVSPGYLGMPELTARTRVEVGGERCYRTGDFGRWDADGVLHFLGRRDGLVKTRGFRVEIGDVESALVRHPDLVEAVVVPVPHPEHTQVLRAVVVPRRGAGPDAAEIVGWCRGELPPYMVPVTVEVRDALPRTSTGKADRTALRTELTAEPTAEPVGV